MCALFLSSFNRTANFYARKSDQPNKMPKRRKKGERECVCKRITLLFSAIFSRCLRHDLNFYRLGNSTTFMQMTQKLLIFMRPRREHSRRNDFILSIELKPFPFAKLNRVRLIDWIDSGKQSIVSRVRFFHIGKKYCWLVFIIIIFFFAYLACLLFQFTCEFQFKQKPIMMYVRMFACACVRAHSTCVH